MGRFFFAKNMKLFAFFNLFATNFALLCEHEKLRETADDLKRIKHNTDMWNEGSRYWAERNNHLREVSRNLTVQIEEIEVNIGYCTDLLEISEENNRRCPSDVSKCIRQDCGQQIISSISFGGSSYRAGRNCQTAPCRECKLCECEICEPCEESWMAYVRANNENHECIIENYPVLKLEKYVLESTELEARQKEHDFHNTFRALTDEVELKRKHHDEASSHYNLCITQLEGSENQLNDCKKALDDCKKSCTVPKQYMQFERYRRLSFKMKKFYLN